MSRARSYENSGNMINNLDKAMALITMHINCMFSVQIRVGANISNNCPPSVIKFISIYSNELPYLVRLNFFCTIVAKTFLTEAAILFMISMNCGSHIIESTGFPHNIQDNGLLSSFSLSTISSFQRLGAIEINPGKTPKMFKLNFK